METFGKRLKHLIKTSDLRTVKKFAEKAGMNDVSISRILTGRYNPSFEVIEACVKFFNDTEIIWLLSGRDAKSKVELENKQLKEQVHFYEEKLGTIAKSYSSRVNPQSVIPGFGVDLSTKTA